MKFNKYIVIVFSAISLYSCGNSEKTTESEVTENQTEETGIILSKQQFEQNNMRLEPLQERPFSVVVQASGMIDVPPENKAIVNAIMGGYVKTTPLLVGDKVRKGQVLITLENPEFVTLQQEYLEINEQLNFLKSEFDRQKILFEEKITSQKKYLKAESEYKTTKAKYTGFKKQLQMLNISTKNAENGKFTSIVTIYAPISGSITKVNIAIGTFVSPAKPIMEIVNTDHLHLELSVYEKDILSLKKGQKIDFKIPEASDEVYKAEVHLIGTSITENRTIKVHGHLIDESQNNFLVGMFVEAHIITANKMKLSLPSDAIVDIDGHFYVLKLVSSDEDKRHFEQVKVEIGSSYEGFTEITNTSDFSSKDQFITKGAFSLVTE
ncbi:MAG: efflux RND transporter periplasmic adaptor subunit [Flavobacteriaceae bacterium]|nr:efflux RND transporter periplasmic adaptor subunit [Flavobacteriaceae bacterium]